MLNRRSFATLLASSIAVPAVAAPHQTEPPRSSTADRLSVMIWTLAKLGSFEQNLETVAKAGYRHVELVAEWKHWSDAETAHLLARMQSLGLSVDATTSGMTVGFATPGSTDAFVAELRTVIPMLQRLRCPQIILLSGKRLDDAAPKAQHLAAIEALKRSADILASTDLVAVIEPIDRIENPSIYLDGVTEAFAIVEAVGSPNIKVLYDLYHEQRGLGNLIEKLDRHIGNVGLIHIADVPGRHEPGTGEINFGNVYRKLHELNYRGMMAMEFYPTGDPVAVLRRAMEEVATAGL